MSTIASESSARPPRRPRDDEALVDWIAERYDRCHPDDSFGDLVKRSSFSKEDRRLMEDWLAAGRGWQRS